VPEPTVVTIPNGQFLENCYLVGDDATGAAAIIDPGEEWEAFLAELDRRRWRLEAIWLTHAHLDHIVGVAEVHAATGAPIWLHPGDRALYDTLPQQGLWFGLRLAAPPPPRHALAAGDSVAVAGHRFEVRHTPGHSPGSISLVGKGVVFVGDALFAGSIGRTDLPGGDYDTLITSIRRELLSLPDETIVLSGHGPPTTIAAERAANPFLQPSPISRTS
jgi:glyoxylase-like metal-dependent hydrolase (beta-lactamase superfamily II)